LTQRELLRNITLKRKNKIENEEASSSILNSDKKGNEIEANPQTSEAEAKIYLNPNINNSKLSSTFLCESISDLDDDDDPSNDLSILSNEDSLKFEITRLNKFLIEIN
jgi:hypothetical protein